MIYLFVFIYASGALFYVHYVEDESRVRFSFAPMWIFVAVGWLPIFLCSLVLVAGKAIWQLIRNLWWTARHDDKKKNLKEAWRIFLWRRG